MTDVTITSVVNTPSDQIVNRINDNTLTGDNIFSGTTKLGDGTTNYSQFGTDGTLTLVGTARKKIEDAIFATRTTKGSSAPTEVQFQMGTTATMLAEALSFSKTIQQDCYFTYHVPANTDGTVSIEFHIMWKPGGSWSTGNYMWKLEYIVKSENADSTTVASTTIEADVTPTNANNLIETHFASTITAVAQQTITCHFYRDVANDNADDVGLIRFFEFERTINGFGE